MRILFQMLDLVKQPNPLDVWCEAYKHLGINMYTYMLQVSHVWLDCVVCLGWVSYMTNYTLIFEQCRNPCSNKALRLVNI